MESTIHFSTQIIKMVQGNKNSVFLNLEYSDLFGTYVELNLDILDQLQLFPFITEYLDSSVLVSHIKQLDYFEAYKENQNVIGQYKTEDDHFLLVTSKFNFQLNSKEIRNCLFWFQSETLFPTSATK